MSATPASRNFLSIKAGLLTNRLIRSATISLWTGIWCSNGAQDFTGINNAPAVVACNSLYVRYIRENITPAAFPCKLFKGVSV